MVCRAQAERHPDLTIFCDKSHPLKEALPHAEAFIKADFSKAKAKLGWPMYAHANIQNRIEMKSSTRTPGIQIADMFAGMTRMVLTDPENEWSLRWESKIFESVLQSSMSGDLGFVDLSVLEPRVNLSVLKELARRARVGADPLAGMHRYYMMAAAQESMNLELGDE
jgi:hypothetical protein